MNIQPVDELFFFFKYSNVLIKILENIEFEFYHDGIHATIFFLSKNWISMFQH